MDSGQQDVNLVDENSGQMPSDVMGQSSLLPSTLVNNSPQMVNPTPVINNNPSPQNTGVDSPAVAEDVDLIEKEWVNKAKKIVESTRNDPSQQNIQLNKFKADYLKTRFNKDIKPMDG